MCKNQHFEPYKMLNDVKFTTANQHELSFFFLVCITNRNGICISLICIGNIHITYFK